MKDAGKTYYSLLQEIEARLPLEEQQQQQQPPSSSSTSAKVEKENKYPVKMNSHVLYPPSPQQQQEEEDQFINVSDVYVYVYMNTISLLNSKKGDGRE